MTGTKSSISHLRVLFCPCVLKESTEYVGTKTLTIRHQEQKSFWGIFVGIPQHKKGYLIYVPHKNLYEAKIQSDGILDKLKLIIVVRGDL